MQKNINEKNIEATILSVINEALVKSKKKFMSLTSLKSCLSVNLKKQLGINQKTSNKKFQEFLEPYVKNHYVFCKKGLSINIVPDVSRMELVFDIMKPEISKTPKKANSFVRSLPFPKSEFSKVLNELIQSGRILVTFTDSLEPKISVNKNLLTKSNNESEIQIQNRIQKQNIQLEQPEQRELKKQKISREDFLRAFDDLDHGKIFVRICDLRKKLHWPRNDFDDMLKELRDDGTIQLHQADATLMTDEEIENSFIDENNYRLGMVMKNDR